MADDYLAVDSGALGAPSQTGGIGAHSVFYVHAVRKRDAVFLDYWIYYAENPNPIAKQLLCAPGLQWSELTCFDHAGDWEGVVVVLEPCDHSVRTKSTCRATDEGRLRIVAVEYAAHRGLTRFSWNTLTSAWQKAKLARARSERPLVFVARDSHASYPRPCGSLPSLGTILGRFDCGPDETNGALAWRNNADKCRDSCLLPLPTTRGGAPASWDAFGGYWGEQQCILYGGYCDRGTAPRSPAFQDRYKEPWHTR
jgi:hypothetical protein